VFVAPDSDGSPVCIGRAYYGGDLLPGKVLLNHNVCHTSFGGGEQSNKEFEYLLNSPRFRWIRGSNGRVPSNAVEGGKTNDGEILYVGRANHLHLLIPGKIHRSHGCLYLPCDWKEHRKFSYEVLVMEPEPEVILEREAEPPESSNKSLYYFIQKNLI
jgi:hypothetical protein